MRISLATATFGTMLVVVPTRAASALNPDTEPDRIDWSQLVARLGPKPDAHGERYGVVLKTLTNAYWRLLARGYENAARAGGATVTVQAAAGEDDKMRQLAVMEKMIGAGYAGLLISPQTDTNLKPGIDEAMRAKIPVVDVDDAVDGSTAHFVGNAQRDNGVLAAKWFAAFSPSGGKVAIIEGQPDVFAAIQRTAGFRETIEKHKAFTLLTSARGDWDPQRSFQAAAKILQAHPDLLGFYCNNDTMALAVVEAVKAAGLLGRVQVIGTDGTDDAYRSIGKGELTGTVDSFPELTGRIALEVMERITAGQDVPRVVTTPQALVTQENLGRYRSGSAAFEAALKEDAAKAR